MAEELKKPATRKRRAKRKGPHPVDVHVGKRVRSRRTLLGMSQEKLGEALGLTFQQVQKYERGANRIGSSRLWELTSILDVPISYFFEDMDKDTSKARYTDDVPQGLAEDSAIFSRDPLAKRETLELVRAYYRIKEPRVRKRVFELTKVLGGKG